MSLLTWPVLGSLTAAAGSLSLAYYLLQYWEKPGARWFIFSLSFQALFCFLYGISLTVFDPALREWFEISAIIALNWIGIPFLGFALEYTGRGTLLRSWAYRGLYLLPLSVTLLLPFNHQHSLFWTDFQLDPVYGVATVSYTFEPLFYIIVLAGTTTAGVGALLLFDTVLSYGPLYRGEALAVGTSFVPPTIGLFVWLCGIGPGAQLNVLVFFLFPHIALDAYAFAGKGMFEFHPATSRAAERTALSDLRQPVAVLDEDGRIVELNEAAETVFEIEEDPVITAPVSTVVGTAIDPDIADRQLSITADNRQLEFRVNSSQLTDSGDNHVGYLLLFQDITDEVQRKRQLAVLNRVLRHNLRNELTIAQGHIGVAEQTETDDRRETSLGKADEALSSLLETSEQAREIEQVLGGKDASPRSVSLRPFLEMLARDTESAHDGATVTADSPALSLQTLEPVFNAVVAQLLENAAEHAEKDNPTISIDVERTEDGLDVTVEDDGPGIPPYELQVLELGEETALEHGSGLGLWLIEWGTVRLGGDLSFETGDDGTRVTLSFPSTMVDEAGQTTATQPVMTGGSQPQESSSE